MDQDSFNMAPDPYDILPIDRQYHFLHSDGWHFSSGPDHPPNSSAISHQTTATDHHAMHDPSRQQYLPYGGTGSSSSTNTPSQTAQDQLHDLAAQWLYQDSSDYTNASSSFQQHPQRLQPSPVDFDIQRHPSNISRQLANTMALASTAEQQQQYMPYTTSMDYGPLVSYQNDLQQNLLTYPLPAYQPDQHIQHHQHQQHIQGPFNHAAVLSSSPTSGSLEMQSSSSSDGSWNLVDYPASRSSLESYRDMPQSTAVSNPGLTLHIRADSSSSQNDMPGSANSINSLGSWEHLPDTGYDMGTDANAISVPHPQQDLDFYHKSPVGSPSSPSSTDDSQSSPTGTSTTNKRRKTDSAPKAASKAIVKKPATKKSSTAAGEKRVGRRRGPLRPEQRIQAGEIRKRGACLRCKFLKKVCDTGDPCSGCQPSHARLWQVPCTRIDIKDIGNFVKTWDADYQRHVSVGFSISNIKGFSPLERPMYITHGFGYVLPLSVREVFVRDEKCFSVDWVETGHESPREFEVRTSHLTAGIDGVSMSVLSEYLDCHIRNGFEAFVDKQFQGTAFLTEMLKTAFRFWQRTKSEIIYKGLKYALAYNLTLHMTYVHDIPDDENLEGKIDDEESNYYGLTAAPVMVNFQVKHAMAVTWRDLQRQVLEDLSSLYQSVYTGDKFKNWPTIFILAAIVLAVWEEIQFDAMYREPDSEAAKKFCKEMETTPVGVVTGLFAAMSQKLPAFTEWDSTKHQSVVNSDAAVCETMTEVRDHVLKYEDYLKTRPDSQFDCTDFDCFSNKFTSKLVIRAN